MRFFENSKRSAGSAIKAAGHLVARLFVLLTSVRGSGVRRRRMRVVESLALGGRRQLLLVMCDEQEYLVGTGAESVETIVFRQTGAEPGVSQTGSAPSNAGQNNTLQTSGIAASAGQRAAAKPGSDAPGGRPALGRRPWLVPTTRSPIAALRIRDADSNKSLELRQ